jgi:hypothetical protein
MTLDYWFLSPPEILDMTFCKYTEPLRPLYIKGLDIVHISIRKFMPFGQEDPNDHYRPWMEKHIGVQGADWDWAVSPSTSETFEIRFIDKQKALLFELTWPI